MLSQNLAKQVRRRKTKFKTSIQKLKIATWNVQTMLDMQDKPRPIRKTALIARELQRLNIDVAALTETRKENAGNLTEGDYTFFWKGVAVNARSAADRRHGVCFAIRNSLVDDFVSSPNGLNERVMSFKLRSKNGKVILFVCAYAPTLAAKQRTKDQFYAGLQTVLDQNWDAHIRYILGDFNARVGTDHLTYKGILGPYGTGNKNSNGDLLLQFCAKNNLVVTNTIFRHKAIHIPTWRHPRSKHWHLIDYVLVDRADRLSVLDTRVMRSAHCKTDHQLVRSRIRIVESKKPACIAMQ